MRNLQYLGSDNTIKDLIQQLHAWRKEILWRIGSASSLPVDDERQPDRVIEERIVRKPMVFPSRTVDLTLDRYDLDAEVYVFPGAAINVDLTALPDGQRYQIHNIGPTFSITLRDEFGTTISTITPGSTSSPL